MYKITTIAIFHTTFIYIDDGSGIGRIIQAFLCLYISLYLITKNKFWRLRKYKSINFLVLLLSGCILFSTYENNAKYFMPQSEMSSPLLGLLEGINLVNLILFLEVTIESRNSLRFFKIFYYIILIYLVIADIDILIHGGGAAIGDYGRDKFFANLIGGKFSVAYKHMLWTLLYVAIHKIKGMSLGRARYFHFFIAILGCILVQCTTALLGVLFIGLIFLRNKEISLLYNPKLIIALILFSCSFLFLFANVLDNKSIQHFIENVLQKDSTLTGRTEIYDMILLFLAQSPIWFGYGPSFDRMFYYMTNYPNTQNGLIEIYAVYGLLYVLLFFIITYYLIRKLHKSEFIYPILLYLYFLVLISCVEITLGQGFITFVFILLFDYQNNYKLLSEPHIYRPKQ